MFENKNKRIEKIRETVKKIREQLTMKQIVFLSLLVGIFGATVCTAFAMERERESQIHIAEQVIRFHIRANSDSKEDQEEKMMVKKQVVEYLQPLMKQATSVQEGRKILSAYKEEIKEVAEKALETTSNRTVQVCLTKEKFPMKRYGDLVFPPGEYEALRVDIGEAKGHNWWCVMYPSLCFIDEAHGIVPELSKEKLQNTLSEEDYESLKPEYHFKLLDYFYGKVKNRFF